MRQRVAGQGERPDRPIAEHVGKYLETNGDDDPYILTDDFSVDAHQFGVARTLPNRIDRTRSLSERHAGGREVHHKLEARHLLDRDGIVTVFLKREQLQRRMLLLSGRESVDGAIKRICFF